MLVHGGEVQWQNRKGTRATSKKNEQAKINGTQRVGGDGGWESRIKRALEGKEEKEEGTGVWRRCFEGRRRKRFGLVGLGLARLLDSPPSISLVCLISSPSLDHYTTVSIQSVIFSIYLQILSLIYPHPQMALQTWLSPPTSSRPGSLHHERHFNFEPVLAKDPSATTSYFPGIDEASQCSDILVPSST